MAYGFAKAALAGVSLTLAVGAVGYSQSGVRLQLSPKAVQAVTSPTQPPVTPNPQVAAFVGATQTMAQPAVATLRDIARSETLTVALDAQGDVLSGKTVTDDRIQNDAPGNMPLAFEGTNDNFAVPVPQMRPRPRMETADKVLAANDVAPAVIRPRVAPQPQVRRVSGTVSSTADSRLRKGLRWSTGEFR